MSTAQAIVEDEVRELVRRRGIDPVAEGGAVRQLVDEVVGDYRDRAVTAALPPLGDPSHVTRRVVDAVAGFGPLQPFLDDPEIEVLQLVIDGLTNGEIAARLFVSDKTVEHHVSRILVKLGVTSRREAARTAHQLDLALPRDASEPRDHRAG